MLAVLHAATMIYGDRMPPLPGHHNLQQRCECDTHTIDAIRGMTGGQKRALLAALEVPASHTLFFLRAMQHCCAQHVVPVVYDGPPRAPVSGIKHWPTPARSANAWSPRHVVEPLEGYYEPVSATPLRAVPPQSPTGTVAPPANPIDAPAAVGLRNQGATCYLNSMLQTLFHLTEFRASVYCIHTADDGVEASGTIPLGLQSLFYAMQTSKTACSTTVLTHSFGWSDTDAYYQHDINEMTTMLLDNLGEKMKATGQDNFVDRLFKGTLQNYLYVPELEYDGSRNEATYDLRLIVKNSGNIYESLDKLVALERLAGSNKYCLEKDDKKSYHEAERGLRIVSLPSVLTVNLNRYEFDPVVGDLAKVLTRWEYYEHVNMMKYLPPDTAPENAEYQLHSVLVHSGSDWRYGHYYCYIKVDGRWVKFNDDSVEYATRQQVFGDNFGGRQLNYWGSEAPRATTAYMLVYVRRAEAEHIVRPDAEIPQALKLHMERIAAEAERKQKERADEHLYVRFALATPSDVESDPGLLTTPNASRPTLPTVRVRKGTTIADLLELPNAPVDLAASQLVGVSRNKHGASRFATLLSLTTVVESVAPEQFGIVPLLVLPRSSNTPTPGAVVHLKLFHDGSLRYLGSVLLDNVGRTHRSLEQDALRLATSLDATSADVVVEDAGNHVIEVTETDLVMPGDVQVWFGVQRDGAASARFPTPHAYFHFLRHRVTIRLYWNNFRKGNPPAGTVEAADDDTYATLQNIVASAHNIDTPRRIRFARHNPDNGCPFAKRQRSVDKPSVRDLLASPQAPNNDKLYFEVCSVDAEVAETSNFMMFEFFDDSVHHVASHSVVLPPPGQLTIGEMLETCGKEVEAVRTCSPKRPLRLVDVWRGRIFNVFEDTTQPFTEKLQETADYRLEFAPQPLPDVPLDEQARINVCHFSKGSQGAVAPHSDPFSMYVRLDEHAAESLKRVAQKLKLPEETVMHWKPSIVVKKEVFPLAVDVSVVSQLRGVKSRDAADATLGLEHTALPGTRNNNRRDEQQQLRIYN